MPFNDACRLLNLEVAPEIADACRFLESRGQRFCVDFGFENAVTKAGEVILYAEGV